MLHRYKLLTTTDYASDAITQINRAKHRVYLSTTTFMADDELSAAFIDALKYAAARGVSVHIAADAFTYTEFRDFSIGTHFRNQRASAARRLTSQLKKLGAKVYWMGRFSPFNMFGRTHTKWCIVDDIVYCFGGVNMEKRSFTNLDYMIRIDDRVMANELINSHKHMIRSDKTHTSTHSRSFASHGDTVYIDGGFVGKSIIYRRACELAETATSITFVSQYCPTGRLSKLLKRTDSQLYFNHWSKADNLNRAVIRYGMLLGKHKSHYQRVPYLHAKFIIFDHNGKKTALTGSHNFVFGGVLAGTREVALETTNHHLIKQLELFLAKHIA